eukprot:TRINITY_DN4435_c0_g1_i2.p1 TRINITY_DN4435_c0_g1~~TRINITY_DN4435_c0_g1_i2.p1  ORF type:complete len:516 (-),score=79.13 TRINITY_DN4435_c0_g1_i2:25-1572(-)
MEHYFASGSLQNILNAAQSIEVHDEIATFDQTLGSTSTQDQTIGKESREKRRKRGDKEGVAASYTKLACTECKTLHKKCDGENPCGSCKRRNSVCTFAEEKRKRGPKPASYYTEIIEKLNQELEAYRQMNNATTSTVARFVEGSQETEKFMSGADIASSSAVLLYAEAFTGLAEGIHGHASDFSAYPLSNSSLSYRYLRYAVLAVGARLVGHLDVAEECLRRASQIETTVFDRIEQEVAAGMMVQCYYYGMIDQLDKTSLRLGVCRSMAESLFRQQQCSENFYAMSLIASTVVRAEPFDRLYFCEKSKTLNITSPNFVTLRNISEARGLVELAEQTQQPVDMARVSQLLDSTEIHLTSLPEGSIQNSFTSAYNAIKAYYYISQGNKQLGHWYCLRGLKVLEDLLPSQCSMCVIVVALPIIAKVLCLCNDRQAMINAQDFLRRMSVAYPIALRIGQMISDYSNQVPQDALTQAIDLPELMLSNDEISTPLSTPLSTPSLSTPSSSTPTSDDILNSA